MYSWKELHPFESEAKDNGAIEKEEILDTFCSYDWKKMLALVDENPSKVKCSPTLEFIDSESRSITFSVFDKTEDLIFMFFFNRKKTVNGFLGFGTKDKEILSEAQITFEESKAIVNSFVKKNFQEIESRFEDE